MILCRHGIGLARGRHRDHGLASAHAGVSGLGEDVAKPYFERTAVVPQVNPAGGAAIPQVERQSRRSGTSKTGPQLSVSLSSPRGVTPSGGAIERVLGADFTVDSQRL